MLRSRVVVLALATLLLTPSAAFAHARLLRSDPPSGGVVGKPPATVRLVFDDVVKLEPGARAIENRTGESVLAGGPRLAAGGREIDVPLRPGLPRGAYTVLWRALSDDGHSIAGVVAFAVGTGAAPPRATLKAPSTVSSVDSVARWMFLAGVLAAGGAALFRLAVRPSTAPLPGLLLAGFGLLIVGAVALVARSSLSTRFGTVVATAAGFALVGAASIALPSRSTRWVATAAALALLLAPSLSGHALDPGRSWLELPVDVVHVAASSLWLGGLLALAVLLRRREMREAQVMCFSTLAGASVAALAATGLLRAISEQASVSQTWTTGYGRLLLAKTAILAVLVGLGWVNRARIIPALMHSRPRLLRNVTAELALFVVLLGVVAVLTQTRPGRDRVAVAAAAAPPAGAQRRVAADAIVARQRPDGLLITGRVQNAVRPDARHVLWETLSTEEGARALLVELDLATRRSTTLARDVAPQYGLAVSDRWIVYASRTVPAHLLAVPRSGGRPVMLAQRLIAPIDQRGDRVAWAELDGAQHRIVVRDLARGTNWVAATLPTCDHGRCYRIDAVTLADRGVAFDRAVGPQPSSVIRRAFTAPRAEAVRVPNDPQPDLIPSSAGAVYYVLGRGWFRWDFGSARPRRVVIPGGTAAQPLAFEAGRWLLNRPKGCRSTVVAQRGKAKTVLGTPTGVLRLAGARGDFCALLLTLTSRVGTPVTTWAVSPVNSHTSEGVTGVIAVRPAR